MGILSMIMLALAMLGAYWATALLIATLILNPSTTGRHRRDHHRATRESTPEQKTRADPPGDIEADTVLPPTVELPGTAGLRPAITPRPGPRRDTRSPPPRGGGGDQGE
ncbi:hypothetical protein NVV99_25630 [Rhodococcus sp. PAE-6]|uniref:hypothetical protein n=1 Tax=Rhodococcus sp. PAE-6 TaxID=2972477 RepID=UPI0021B1A6BB|nr:hypothetical protein [Rhodococcus sp. PAE-6]MCT7294272.1 hypothetical protein [Rhodococcus sp. PAE-6]